MTPDPRPPARPDGALVRLALWMRSGRLAAIGPFARDVLLSLAAHETIDRGAYPSADTIAFETGRTKKLVYRQLQRLTTLGITERIGRTRNVKANIPWTVAYRILPCPPSTVDIHSRGISERLGSPSPVPSIPISDSPGYPSAVPMDIPLGGTQRGSEGVLKDIEKGCGCAAGFASLLGDGPQNGNGTAKPVVFRRPSGRIITLEEHIREAETFGFGDLTLAKSLGVPVEAIQAKRREMAEQTSEASKERPAAGGNGNDAGHPDQAPAEIVHQKATSATVGVL